MKIHASNTRESVKINIQDFRETMNGPDDLLFECGSVIATIVDAMAGELIPLEEPEDRQRLSLAILDITKTMMEGYYEEMTERKPELQAKRFADEMYDDMLEFYDYSLSANDNDGDELINNAQNSEANYIVAEKDETLMFQIMFSNKIYTIESIVKSASDEEKEVAAFKASMFVYVLYDKAFPEDESKNPVRNSGKLNIYKDLLPK